MKLFKFNKRVEIKKNIGNLKLQTFHYGSFDENGKSKNWTELCLWYDNDCENCPCGWEERGYEGECEDCGCLISKDGDFSAPTWVCMLPNWIKNIVLKQKKKAVLKYGNYKGYCICSRLFHNRSYYNTSRYLSA